MEDFNQQQKDFISSMGDRFRDGALGFNSEQILALLGLGGFLATVLVIYFLYQNRSVISRKLTFLGRILAGKSVATDRRKKNFEVAVRQPGDSLGRVYHGHTMNLSPRGMYLKLNPPLERGDSFHFLIETQKGRLTGMAEVAWVQPNWSDHHSTGMGCKFLYVSPEEQKVLLRVLAS